MWCYPGNCFFQMSRYPCTYAYITNEKIKGKFPWENHVVWIRKIKLTYKLKIPLLYVYSIFVWKKVGCKFDCFSFKIPLFFWLAYSEIWRAKMVAVHRCGQRYIRMHWRQCVADRTQLWDVIGQIYTIGRMVVIYTTLEIVGYLLLLKTESLDNKILELWLAEPSWLWAIIPNMCNCTNKLKISWFLQVKSGGIHDILWVFLIKQLFHSCLLDMRWL